MSGRIRTRIRGERGQDIVEYSLILAFVCLVAAAMYIGMNRDTQGLWTVMNSRLANANQSGS
jgi:Flp pilus assembly pilin Flp